MEILWNKVYDLLSISDDFECLKKSKRLKILKSTIMIIHWVSEKNRNPDFSRNIRHISLIAREVLIRNSSQIPESIIFNG